MGRRAPRRDLSVEEAEARIRRAAKRFEAPPVVRSLVRARPFAAIAVSLTLGVALGASPVARRIALRGLLLAASRPGPARRLARRLRRRARAPSDEHDVRAPGRPR